MSNEIKGKVLKVRITNLSRAMWVYEAVEKVNDGSLIKDAGSDPFSTERECRKAARIFANNAKYNREYGWYLD